MKRAVRIGFIDAIISSVSYGLYPLFAILLYNTGSSVSNSLFYRYLFAFLIYLYILKVHKKINLSVTVKEFIILFFVGITFAVSSIALFAALKYIDSGIACTIVFVYPVIVALIMTLFFHEKLTKTTVISIACAFLGVALLNYAGGMSTGGKFLGFLFSVCGAIMYAMYKPNQWIYVLCLAVIPTIVAIETVNVAIKLIGATKTSIIGALEPLTAIIVGVLVFGEQVSLFNAMGFLLVITGIFLVVRK